MWLFFLPRLLTHASFQCSLITETKTLNMKVFKYLLSFFYDVEKEIRKDYFDELVKFRDKLLEARNDSDPYEAIMLLVNAVYNRSAMFENISKCLEYSNYGQYDYIIKVVKEIEEKIKEVNQTCFVILCNNENHHKGLLSNKSNVYVAFEKYGDRTSLEQLERIDKSNWHAKTLQEETNFGKLKDIIRDTAYPLYNSANTLISYVKE